MKTHGSAAWSGGIKDGKGSISTRAARCKPIPTVSPAGSRASPAATRRN